MENPKSKIQSSNKFQFQNLNVQNRFRLLKFDF